MLDELDGRAPERSIHRTQGVLDDIRGGALGKIPAQHACVSDGPKRPA